MNNKRSALTIGDLSGIAITLVTLAIILGIGSTILSSIKNQQDDNTAFYGNQSLIWGGNNTGIGLAEGRGIASTFVLFNNGSKVNKGEGANANYTATEGIITILNSSPSGTVGFQSEWVTNALNLTYTYNYGSYAGNSTSEGLKGLKTLSDYQTIIALIAAAAVIISIVLVFFGRRT
jgi:hypothetical protein